ncbi:hypothetical protein VNO77_01906 [Canavalia gladiata]|uniref:Secreted protein n=1 Tax=Canavalia gladiata TaxID=3824 RepID=A0AAN9MSN3_CANGL
MKFLLVFSYFLLTSVVFILVYQLCNTASIKTPCVGSKFYTTGGDGKLILRIAQIWHASCGWKMVLTRDSGLIVQQLQF